MSGCFGRPPGPTGETPADLDAVIGAVDLSILSPGPPPGDADLGPNPSPALAGVGLPWTIPQRPASSARTGPVAARCARPGRGHAPKTTTANHFGINHYEKFLGPKPRPKWVRSVEAHRSVGIRAGMSVRRPRRPHRPSGFVDLKRSGTRRAMIDGPGRRGTAPGRCAGKAHETSRRMNTANHIHRAICIESTANSHVSKWVRSVLDPGERPRRPHEGSAMAMTSR